MPEENTEIVKNNETTETTIFTREYVHELREEAKAANQEKKMFKKMMLNYESKFRDMLGLEATADLNDLDNLVTNYKTTVDNKIAEATDKINDVVRTSTIKSLADKYDTDLLEALIDKKQLKVEDNKVINLDEIINPIVTKFPKLIKEQPANDVGANPAYQFKGKNPAEMTDAEYIEYFKKRNKK
jgi:hypothetical protein